MKTTTSLAYTIPMTCRPSTVSLAAAPQAFLSDPSPADLRHNCAWLQKAAPLIEQLSPHERLVMLCFLEGNSLRETSEHLAIEETRCAALRRNALRRIRQVLSGKKSTLYD